MWPSIQHYHRPRSLEHLFDLRAASPDARLLAGGTDLLVRMRAGSERPRTLISLRSVPQLQGVDADDAGHARIGAAVTIAQLQHHPAIIAHFPVLAQAASCLGSPQIRNVATIGGNLCNASPCADTAPPLLVLQARVELLGPGGGRRELPLEQLFQAAGETSMSPSEVLGAVLLDPPPAGSRALFVKKRRVRMDLALASLAVLLDPGSREVRVAAGSVAPTPIRLSAVERLLQGQELDPRLLAEARELASASVTPISDIRSTESYRRHIIGLYLERTLEQLWQEATA